LHEVKIPESGCLPKKCRILYPMTTNLLYFIFNIAMLLLFLLGTLWMWKLIKFPKATQSKLDFIFSKSRTRFKWLFLIGFILLVAARIVRMLN